MHETDFDHEHEELYARAGDLEGLERLTLTSVGIDIGSSTTHLLFSRLTLRREGARHSTQFKVSQREVVWSSPILLTPYLSATRIDFAQIHDFIEQGYGAAGLKPDDIDTGAVVITGEALKKENARPIAEYFAREGGKFVCASAGPHHEALLAAHGSGAVQLSKISRSRVLNIDIGGGTTKLSLIGNGEILETAAIALGARLIALDKEGAVCRLEEAGLLLARQCGFEPALGKPLPDAAPLKIAALMAEILIAILNLRPVAEALWLTGPLKTGLTQIDYLVFSGGVSEYLHGATADFGDLGPALGMALRPFLARLPAGMVQEPAQGIRATVIGASAYTVQVSGTTSFFAAPEMLPLSGLKVVRVRHGERAGFAGALAAALQKFDVESLSTGLMLSLSLELDIDYAVLREIAEGLGSAAAAAPHIPLIVNVEQDVAHVLGHMLHDELKLPNPLLVIDGIIVGDLDFVDIGRPVSLASVFPVTVKSLLFSPPALP